MSVYDDIANAKTFEQGGNYFVPGRFRVKVERAWFEPSAKAPREKMAKVEFRVIEFEARENTPTNRYRPGDKVAWIVNTAKAMGPENVKSFAVTLAEQLLWAKGADPADVRALLKDFAASPDTSPHPASKHIANLFAPEGSPLVGLEIEVLGFNKPKANGEDFTRIKWFADKRPVDFDPRG